MNDDEKCGNCYYYDQSRCKFGPPVLILLRLQDISPSCKETHYEFQQPVQLPNGWCGQWAPRRDETPPYPPPDIPDQKVATRVRRQRERVAPIADVDAEIEHENDPESER
jgi:hypothetical protein